MAGPQVPGQRFWCNPLFFCQFHHRVDRGLLHTLRSAALHKPNLIDFSTDMQ